MLLLFIFSLLSGIQNDLALIRDLYIKAATQEPRNRELLLKLSLYTDQDVLCEAYKGAATMLMAKHSLNPYTKLKYFKDGKKILENAIRRDPNNIEARYLRYTIQSNLPVFLGYNTEMPGDKKFLTASLPLIKDMYLQRAIHNFLARTNTGNKQQVHMHKIRCNSYPCTS